jgi:hypothetical protein
MIYRIGSFNVRNLNYPGSKDSRRAFDTIAAIIKENFDVVALQEVLSDKVWEQLKIYLGEIKGYDINQIDITQLIILLNFCGIVFK